MTFNPNPTWPCDCCGEWFTKDGLRLIRGRGIDPGDPIQLCYPCFERNED